MSKFYTFIRQLRKFAQNNPPWFIGIVIIAYVLANVAFIWFRLIQVALARRVTTWGDVPFRAEYLLEFLVWSIFFAILALLVILWGLNQKIKQLQVRFLDQAPTSDDQSQPPPEPIWVKNFDVLTDHPKEFLPIIQKAFQDKATGVELKLASQGYSGALVLFVTLTNKKGKTLQHPNILKLDTERSITGEYEKYEEFVDNQLKNVPGIRGKPITLESDQSFAGLVYELAGISSQDDLVSFQKFYRNANVTLVKPVIEDLFQRFKNGWYKGKDSGWHEGPLYHHYFLLQKKFNDALEGVIIILEDQNQQQYRSDVALASLDFSKDKSRLYGRPEFLKQYSHITWLDPFYFLLSWHQRKDELFKFYHSPVHGDLRAQNIILDVSGKESITWLIDFSHSGNGFNSKRTQEAIQNEGLNVDEDYGHTLRDFARLEADLKFAYTPITESEFGQVIEMEEQLLVEFLPKQSPTWSKNNSDFNKVWECILCLRQLAKPYVCKKSEGEELTERDLRPYYLALLASTLPVVYYKTEQFPGKGEKEQKDHEYWQKRFAFASAGMLCARLDN